MPTPSRAFQRKATDYLMAAFNGGGGTSPPDPECNAFGNTRTDYIDCGNDPTLSEATTTAFSVAFFVRPYNRNSLPHNGDPFTAPQVLMAHGRVREDDDEHRFAVEMAGTNFDTIAINFGNGIGAANAAIVLGTQPTLIQDEVAHVTITYDGDTQTVLLYVDGVLDEGADVASGTVPDFLIDTAVPLSIARWTDQLEGTAIPFQGALGEIRYYGRVITGDEAALLAAHEEISTANLLLHLPLDGTFEDLTGRNAITPYGEPLSAPTFVFSEPTDRNAGFFRVLAFGDSLTSGSGWPGGWRINFFDHMKRLYGKYVHILGQQSDTTAPDYWLDTTHDGIAGQLLRGEDAHVLDPAHGIISRIASSVASAVAGGGVDLCIVMGMGNDVGHSSHNGADPPGAEDITAEDIRDSWRAVVDMFYAQSGIDADTPMILVPGTRLSDMSTHAFHNSILALLPALVANFRSGATGYTQHVNLRLNHISESVEVPEDLLQSDTHPNRKAYEAIGAGIAVTADSLLELPVVNPSSSSGIMTHLPRASVRITRALTFSGTIAR